MGYITWMKKYQFSVPPSEHTAQKSFITTTSRSKWQQNAYFVGMLHQKVKDKTGQEREWNSFGTLWQSIEMVVVAV